MGIISPVGNDIDTAWNNVREGHSGIGPVTEINASEFPTRIAGERHMVIDHAGGLYVRIDDATAHKLEPSLPEILAPRV